MKKRNILINIKGIVLFVSQAILLFSCFGKDNKRIISGYSDKYWDVYRMNNIIYAKARYGYHFKNDGTCIYYSYSKNEIKGNFKRDKFDFGDVIYPETWAIKNSSVINILGLDYRLLHLSEDRMIVVNVLNKQDTMYLKLSEMQ